MVELTLVSCYIVNNDGNCIFLMNYFIYENQNNFEMEFSFLQSAGNQVVEFLQKLCSNDVNMPVGGVVHSGMQNERGGYENDCLLIRRTDNRCSSSVKQLLRYILLGHHES